MSPDKLEEWLEKMGLQGYCLRYISRRGQSFYFTRGRSRTVKYCADFQLMADRKYFQTHAEAGWKPVYAGLGSFLKWMIWAKEYQDHPPQPLYTDKAHLLRHARLISVMYTSFLIPHIILQSVLIKLMAENAREFVFLYSIFLSIFILFTIRAWLYYRRMKKQATACN